MLVSIFDGELLIETRECRRVWLPDSRPGVVWRGLAYPLRAGDRLEVADEAFSPAACAAGGEPRQEGSTADRVACAFALIDGRDEAYLVLPGSVLDCEQATGSLREAGIRVLRTGRYLGEPVDGVEGDWFIRFVKPTDRARPVRELIAGLLGRSPADEARDQAGPELRARLLGAELAAAKAREAGLRTEVAHYRLREAEQVGAAEAEVTHLRLELEEERRLREVAEAAAMEAERAEPVPPAPRPAAPARIRDEIESVLAALLPRVRLVRDSINVIAAEYGSRRAVYRALAELHENQEQKLQAWKRIRGAEGWWERHVNNGHDDAGRIYAKLDKADRVWDVLVSHKGEQTRDVTWLSRWRGT
ncbi:hypothetical protein [Microvirga yunnanensis]|uniref:hypothetical protein n=1 Tax=Microvirga yunnanensis TaxID=2953740 RepID=UPI0021C82CA4|nr:hypothetical protein [Microvirga sp. HBU65207]